MQLICRQLQLVPRPSPTTTADASAYAAHPDHAIFASLPGAGPVLGPRLLASLGSQRERFAAAADLQHYTGMAPVTKRSGGSCYIHRRYLCPEVPQAELPRVCQGKHTVEPLGGGVLPPTTHQGSPHHTAVRALAFKWQRVIWRCWQDRTPYEEATMKRRCAKAAATW